MDLYLPEVTETILLSWENADKAVLRMNSSLGKMSAMLESVVAHLKREESRFDRFLSHYYGVAYLLKNSLDRLDIIEDDLGLEYETEDPIYFYHKGGLGEVKTEAEEDFKDKFKL